MRHLPSRINRALLTTVGVLVLLAGCNSEAVPPVPAAHALPAPILGSASAPMLPCLHPDSLRFHGDTLHFSTLHVHEETGDQLGIDLHLVHRDTAWTGSIAKAEGVLLMAIPLRAIQVDPSTKNMSFEWEQDDSHASFRGTLSCSAVIGGLRWYPGRDVETDTLPRIHDEMPASSAR